MPNVSSLGMPETRTALHLRQKLNSTSVQKLDFVKKFGILGVKAMQTTSQVMKLAYNSAESKVDIMEIQKHRTLKNKMKTLHINFLGNFQ